MQVRNMQRSQFRGFDGGDAHHQHGHGATPYH